jgi:GNAT superfamily N-acetyltransferase
MNGRADIAWSHVAQISAQVSRLPGGESVTIRPVRRRDADALQAYFRGLSGETRYRRFLGAIGGTSCLIGEAVLVSVPGSSRSEMALSVGDAWQRKGVGSALVRDLECRARIGGARYLYGDVLRTNIAMKNLARKAGFALRSPFTDARLIEIGKDLSMGEPDLPCRKRFAQVQPPVDRDIARSLAGPE